jgi:FkbM family methyltransferase
MNVSPKARLAIVALLVVGVALVAGACGVVVGRQYERNHLCCVMPRYANLVLSVKEVLGLVSFPSQIGQDKWVSETVFPGVTDGFFVDVGSGDGVDESNTVLLERKGWRGICIDPLPTHMEGRTCQMFKDVVYDKSGKTVTFHTAGKLSGVTETLGAWKSQVEMSPTLQFTTVTLGDILDRAKAPPYIQFMSLDIEGAELEALRGLPFDKYRFGAFAIEHNYERPKRSNIQALLESHGYTRVNSWLQDDFYVPTNAATK